MWRQNTEIISTTHVIFITITSITTRITYYVVTIVTMMALYQMSTALKRVYCGPCAVCTLQYNTNKIADMLRHM